MRRLVPALVCPASVLGLSLWAAPTARPPLPKDTLPATLSLDAIPRGLDRTRPVPKDNPLTEEKVRLGRKLFFDPVLSADRTVSCASCHDPAHGFAGTEAQALGIRGKRGRRKAPSLLNVAYGGSFFWDGRAATLEAQALHPIQDQVEMGNTLDEVAKRLKGSADYRKGFEAAFKDGVTSANLGKALASFERTLLSGNSKIDRFRAAGDADALTDAERHGLWLFESRGRCWKCHSGGNFTDGKFHNTGVSWGKKPADLGRFEVTKKEEDRGRFKTPSLRGVARTSPYMHDGSLKTLAEVIDYYDRGGNKNPHLDGDLLPLKLTKDEKKSLLAFLEALSESPGKRPKK
jgi:cytochrome c peroxidase